MESNDVYGYQNELLECLEKLVHYERQLTAGLTRVLPLVSSEETDYKLATPKNMEEVSQILAYARTLSTRTSAPCGWNPSLPLIGFATPNPLPHQIRGGCLGVMQLQQVKQEQARSAKSISKGADNSMVRGDQKGAKPEVSSSKIGNTEADNEALAVAKAHRKDRATQRAADEERRKKKAREAEEAKQRLTMNLSESSSSSDSEDDTDEED